MGKTLGIGIAVVLIAIIGIYMLIGLGYKRQEVSLRTEIEAQQEFIEPAFDTMWKIIQTKACVPDKFKNDFKEAYQPFMEGRKGGDMWKWVQEHNPQYDSGIYQDLMDTIEGKRAEFLEAQKRLIDLNRQHKALLRDPISGHFLKGRKEIKLKLITSTTAKNAIETGVEDEIDPFATQKKTK